MDQELKEVVQARRVTDPKTFFSEDMLKNDAVVHMHRHCII